MDLRLDTPIQFLKGVGPKLGDLLRAKGVENVKDLLEWYPRAYEDRRAARTIASLRPDELVSLKAQVLKVSSFNMGRSTRKIYDVTLRDDSGKIHCKYFRVPYKGYFERFKPGQWVRVIGKVSHYRGQIEFSHPDIQDDTGEGVDDDMLLPVYPESEGLTNRQIKKLIALALSEIKRSAKEESSAVVQAPLRNKTYAQAAPPEPIEKLPPWMREKYQLPDRLKSLEMVHVPPKDGGEEFVNLSSPFHRRIIFEEFFWLELYLAARKAGLKKERAPQLTKDFALVEKLVASLPFKLTGAQEKSFAEIANDLAKPHPMHRLVQGDVGSGKTMVALMAAAMTVQNRLQACVMVPTEILAEQHYQNFKRLLEPLGITVGLLTGTLKGSEKQQTGELLKRGVIQVCVGTHALIQDTVEFQNLGLVIIDEQHRFGVHQRSRLKQKGVSPHFLIMTATPIPRTLAMTVYGDLDVSVIDELPVGRSPIVTRIAYESARVKMMRFMREQIKQGRQAYVVYPLVEESEKIDLKDAISQFERLKAELPDHRIGLLHGRMKPAEKDEVMRRFRAQELQILVATTVIEVGVDVPNANLMIIEHAERFGLSQLHQLRGRVGRGQHKSFCVLMLGKAVSDESRARTQIMEKTTDGFKIAEADLEIRGPGEFLGTRQSGLPGFKLANLVRDVKILQDARQAAFEALSRDAKLDKAENRHLREELLKAHGATSLASVG